MTNYVAWTMQDGNVMAGTIRERLCDTLYITRVDGGSCSIKASETRPATPEDIEAACQFFANISKPHCPQCGNTENLETDQDVARYSCEACEITFN